MISKLTLAARGLFYVGKYFIKHQENVRPILRSYRFFNSKLRISTAAILLLEDKNEFVLIENHHRPEYYAPIGGVHKHTVVRPGLLDKIEWQPDYTRHTPKLGDMDSDLRGIISGKRFPDFLNWFTSREDRECDQCIIRELREELQEGGVGKILRDKSSEIRLSVFRRVLEGPLSVDDRDYAAQFRYFEVFRPDTNHASTSDFSAEIFKRARKGDNRLLVAKKSEILAGRTDSQLPIAGHTKYFFSSKWHGMEPAKY